MKKFICAIALSIASIGLYQAAAFADAPAKVHVTNFSELTNANAKIVNKNIIPFFTALLKASPDPILGALFSEMWGVEADQNQLQSALGVALNSTVGLDLADDRTKTQNSLDLATLPAGDDNPTLSFPPPLSGYLSNIFSLNTNKQLENAAKQANLSNNKLFNVESFLGTYQYNPLEAITAQNYIRYIMNLAPSPTVIALGQRFSVPYSPDIKKTSTVITIPKIAFIKKGKLSIPLPYNLGMLQKELNANADYREYRLNYRTQIAVRSLLLSNIIRAYQERVSVDGGKSIAQIDHDEAYRRLQKPYYDKMSKASPATIQLETLLVLSEINRQLYEMHQDQERLLIMQSISGLQASAISKYASMMQTKKIGKLIYCTIPTNKKKKECKSKSVVPGADASDLPGGQ